MKSKKEDLTDSQIIYLITEGDSDMYSVIMERYKDKLLRYATYLLKDYDVASDAVQETFIKAYINLRSFNAARQFSPWIYRILHNEAMNVIKRSKKIISIRAADEVNDNFLVHFSKDKEIDKALLDSNVRKCINQIDIKYQEVIALMYFDNLKYNEISDILHIPTSTVGIRIRRGKAILKKICQNYGVKYE